MNFETYAEKGRWSVKSLRLEGDGFPQPYTRAVEEMNENWMKERNEDKAKIVKEGKEWVLYVKEDYAKGGEADCNNCGSKLGIDCGDAEPDYNEKFCSKGCYKETKNKNNV